MKPAPLHSGSVDWMDVWKHFAETGGHDKDRMVNICSWLLAFSTVLAGLAFVQEVHPHLLSERSTFIVLGLFGFLTSIASGLVALMYGGYANWNWAKADQIARANTWEVLDPKNDPWTKEQKAVRARMFARWGRGLCRPTETYSRLAPIFSVFIGLSLVLAAGHLVIIVLAAVV